ncbi:hypothetical protein QO004_002115 [Rhizobium mesoamericanum]|uniref:nuclear transport factor 2 family protein n=1 Tax=Rhizobium mesoamericanum TaxID=1079800 RepID=UPI002783751B|nr:nuclear transport factor 2 family protein [Rhizobium mesoamericanum]MDQ0560333.1 hypothetical protein [Rhizobium mesoamericanum]
MKPVLPEPIAAYFAADKQDAEAVARCFAENAIVKDEGETHAGLAAIKTWRAETAAKYNYTSEPIAIEEAGGATIVTSRLTGNFPNSPVDLRFCFRLDDSKISSLEIVL